MTETIVVIIVGAVVGAMVLYFVGGFVRPWLRMRSTLDRARGVFLSHQDDAATSGGQVTDLDEIRRDLAFDEHLVHLWQEFRHTLHAEHSENEFDEHGQPATLRYRQTVPAEVYFSSRSLIDVPLRTEFFKHLPGILTGLGIIGTFGGLIIGLSQFNVSGDADHVNDSVAGLVGSVKKAFGLSAVAITASIVVTFIEKSAAAGLNRRIQRLQNAIDRMFDAGAGEDYLSDIATQSEQTATHLAHLKDGLVNDIRVLLENLGEQQSASTLAAAELIGTSVTTTLEAPLSSMASAMERSLEDQQQVVHRLMDDSLNAFAARLEEAVGEQLTGAAGHVEAAANSFRAALVDAPAQLEAVIARVKAVLEEVASSAEPIAANAERIGHAADKLATTIEQSTETLDYAIERLRSVGLQMGESLASAEAIGEALSAGAVDARSAAESLNDMVATYEKLSVTLKSVVDTLAEAVERADRDAAAQEALVASVERAAEQLSTAQRGVDDFLASLAAALAETHDAFSREINATLDRTHESFHHSLASATETLASTVNGFSEFLESDFRESVDDLRAEFVRLRVADDRSSPS
jgi:hypothetical protein